MRTLAACWGSSPHVCQRAGFRAIASAREKLDDSRLWPDSERAYEQERGNGMGQRMDPCLSRWRVANRFVGHGDGLTT